MSSKLFRARQEFMLIRYHGRKTAERIKQKISSNRQIPAGEKSIHIICVRKKEYLKAGIKCANSIWYHNPNLNVVFHIDSELSKFKDYMIQKLHRKDRIKFEIEDSIRSWQELKLNVILHGLKNGDYFCDADLYWNSRLPEQESGMYFAAETALLSKEPYFSALSAAGIEIDSDAFMANSSFIAIGYNLEREEFSNEVEDCFRKLMAACSSGRIEGSARKKILRLSEQISLSIAINNRRDYFSPLKASDKPMDGGIAESYYLGTTKGWD